MADEYRLRNEGPYYRDRAYVPANENPAGKMNFSKGCLMYGCGCLSSVVLLFLICIGIGLIVTFMGDSEDNMFTDVTVKTVPGFDRKGNDCIAVIPVHGVIMSGKKNVGIITPETFSAMMEKAEKNPHVKAIIISIDSPGGEVNAADEIYRRILAYKAKNNKPVIALMKSIAASGGYYVAAACDKIVASDTTLTGSIGVIISSYNVKGLLDKIGVKGEVYKSGEMKDMLSPTKDRTPEEQKIVQEMVQDCYLKFAKIVSKSRKIPLEKITKGPIGDGRVYHGSKALGYGMVDKIGHLEEAVELCEKMTKSGKNTLSVRLYQKSPGLFDSIMEGKGSLKDGVNVNLNLPGKTPGVELEPGRIYLLPAGL